MQIYVVCKALNQSRTMTSSLPIDALRPDKERHRKRNSILLDAVSFSMEPSIRVELMTSSLPWMRSAY